MFNLMQTFKEEIVKDLKEIMSSEDITKVVHDFRFSYDFLNQYYKIELNPIFDLMAVATLEGFPSDVLQNFESFLGSLLNIATDFVSYTFVSGADQDDMIKLAQYSAYLLPMHQRLTRLVFSNFLDNIDSSKYEFLDSKRQQNFFLNVQKNLQECDALKAIL